MNTRQTLADALAEQSADLVSFLAWLLDKSVYAPVPDDLVRTILFEVLEEPKLSRFYVSQFRNHERDKVRRAAEPDDRRPDDRPGGYEIPPHEPYDVRNER